MIPSLTIALAIVVCSHCDTGDVSEGLRELGRAIAKFSQNLYTDLALQQVNSVYSPASIHLALSMIYLGAKGNTAEEMRSILQLTSVKDPYQSQQVWIKEITSQGDVHLNIANSLWYNDDYVIYPDYQKKLKETYQADVEKIDFTSDKPEQQINRWVAGKTENKILQIIPTARISKAATILALVNAIYFNGKWDMPFSNKSTLRNRDFTRLDGTKVKVDYMNQVNFFKVKKLESLKAYALKLYYEGRRFSLNFISPVSPSGLRDIEEKLINGSVQLDSILDDMTEKSVEIRVPKFKVTAKVNLNEIMRNLSLNRVFSNSPDFSGISPSMIKITEATHMSVIEVREIGTEAAASTSIWSFKSAPPSCLALDHSFLFFLMDEKHQAILFQGKITDPTIEEIDVR